LPAEPAILECPSVSRVVHDIKLPSAMLAPLQMANNDGIHFKIVVSCNDTKERDYRRAAERPNHPFWTIPAAPCENGTEVQSQNMFATLLADPGNDKLRETLYIWCVDQTGNIPNESQFVKWLENMAFQASIKPGLARPRARSYEQTSAERHRCMQCKDDRLKLCRAGGDGVWLCESHYAESIEAERLAGRIRDRDGDITMATGDGIDGKNVLNTGMGLGRVSGSGIRSGSQQAPVLASAKSKGGKHSRERQVLPPPCRSLAHCLRYFQNFADADLRVPLKVC
jgi:hypothetical protein